MAVFHCDICKRETQHVPIYVALTITGVSRSTIYYWMERGWVHWREVPSSRRYICTLSLSRPGGGPDLRATWIGIRSQECSGSVRRCSVQ